MIVFLSLCWSCVGKEEDSAFSTVSVEELCSVEIVSSQEEEQIDCGNGTCFIPTGKAILGQANIEHPDQCPMQEVDISGFSISTHETTVAEWEECVAQGACDPQPEWCQYFFSSHDPSHPITCVSWEQADSFCRRKGGRLPTEAEWEVAARGRNGQAWPWGLIAPSCNRANHKFVTAYCEGGVLEVGSLPMGASPFGVEDVAGNVWEWVDDWYDATYYQVRSLANPQSPTTCASRVEDERGECTMKVLRGGAWDTTEDTLAPFRRNFAPPELIDVNIGFRCAWDGE